VAARPARLEAKTESYQGTRFNALKQGVLSHDTVLPWECESEYDALLDALIAEHRPQGPTEEHLSSGTGWHYVAQAAIDKRTCNRQHSTKPCTASVSFCLSIEDR